MALHSGPTLPTLFGAAMVLVGGVVLLVSARYVWRATAVYRAAPVDSIRGVDPGSLVRASGTAERGDDGVVVAPFSGTDCVALRYAVEERRPSVVVLPWFVTVHTATGAVGFDVRTDAGTVPVVEPVRTVALSTDRVAAVDPGEELPETIRSFVAGHGDIPVTTVWHRRPPLVGPLFRALSLGRRRYLEQRAAVGDEITVVGRVAADGAGVDPLVVSDRSPTGTVLGMARTTLGGVAAGVCGVVLGVALLVVL